MDLGAAISTEQYQQVISVDSRNWSRVNDTVMGGLSRGRFVDNEGVGVFEGFVSLANNGGFALVRQATAAPLFRPQRISIKVKGDGKRYRLRLKSRANAYPIGYDAPFQTRAGVWQEFSFDPSRFQPKFRGQPVANAAPLRFDDVSEVGFIIADKQAGEFRLQIASISWQTN
ncbi:CIA30 family protein [Paraferrimonas haliotis]|uniref:NADH:ubiquinone oxidoreductase n=2 Tax=Paraferrimonas haliotis TaxID=2013866 RepID=A0AA37TNG4_9GAMM|nr:CIA30 family protein [Paraferrimonas haliotis]GLS83713.1 NADH:ubiquinone oxidoreductase [Paraferrimonas haliotis]